MKPELDTCISDILDLKGNEPIEYWKIMAALLIRDGFNEIAEKYEKAIAEEVA